MKRFILGAAMAAAMATGANAVTVDGVFSASEYAGATVTHVGYDPAQPTDFSAWAQASELTAYDVYFTADATNIYVGLVSDPAGAGLDKHDQSLGLTFTNLYFDTSPGTGSDVGFEVFNDRSFVPGGACCFVGLQALGGAYAKTVGTTYLNGGAASVIEFSMPWTYFMDDPQGLGFGKVAAGGGLQLRISQSFGYAPVFFQGGPYNAAKFGTVFAPVPEPSTWALMLMGFLGAGSAIRLRQRALVRA